MLTMVPEMSKSGLIPFPRSLACTDLRPPVHAWTYSGALLFAPDFSDMPPDITHGMARLESLLPVLGAT